MRPSSYPLLDELDSLAELLDESPEEVRVRELTALLTLLESADHRVVLFGAGTLGRRAFTLLQAIGATVLAFSDNNPALWNTKIEDITVLSPREAAHWFGTNAIFFVTIWNDFHWYSDTLGKLTDFGCKSVSSYAPIFWKFGERFMDLRLLNEPAHLVYQDIQSVLEAEDLWADEESLESYRANIVWRALGDPSYLPYPAPQNTYFPADIFRVSPHETVVDCGAFDGDTLRHMLSISPEFKAFYAVEADTVSTTKLRSYIEMLPTDIAAKVHELDCAVGAERCTLKFAMSGAATSKIEDAGVDVACIPLDELFADIRVTLIKMDIEEAKGSSSATARSSPFAYITLRRMYGASPC
jgi:FkbM family methyltransferase